MEIFVEKLNKADIVKLGGVPQSVRFKAQLIFVDMSLAEQKALGFGGSKAILSISGDVGYGTEKDVKDAISNAVNKRVIQYENKIKLQTTEVMELSGFDSKFTKLSDI